MALDLVKLTHELLKNARVAARVAELALTPQQIHDALPIMLAMVEEEQDSKRTLNYQTTIGLNDQGEVLRMKVLTTAGKQETFLANIITLDYYAPNFKQTEKIRRTAERQVIVTAFSKLLKANSEGARQGFYITGAQGIGKSFLLKLFARKFAEAGKTVAFMPTYEIINVLRQNFGIKADLIATLKSADILFLDDFGDESIYSWARDEVFLVVLAYRLANDKLTFFGSHYTHAELEKIQARTTGERYVDQAKARRLVELIKAASVLYTLTT